MTVTEGPEMSGLQIAIIFLAFIGLLWGPHIYDALYAVNPRRRARKELTRRGYCLKHMKKFIDQRRSEVDPRCYTSLCEDCIPEYEEAERKRLEYLMKVAR